MKLEEKYALVLDWFSKNMEKPESELHFENPFQLLVAVMLSAQCTDKRVNMVTPALFEAFPTAAAMAAASEEEILGYVKSVSYPNSKTKHLKQMAEVLHSRFDGEVPADRELLQTLPGVGRKTANVVLAVAFGQPAMPVDTHVFRVSHRLGLVKASDNTPDKVEAELTKHIPSEILGDAHHYLLLHGRYVCTAKKPKCAECGLFELCNSKGAE